MTLWTIIEVLLDWHTNWRFNMCLYGGVAVGIAAGANVPQEPLNFIVSGAVFITCVVAGWWWNGEF